jgi:hypothetical protein
MNNPTPKINIIHLAEIGIWTLILILIVFGGIGIFHHFQPDRLTTVVFGDVDGMDIGAPVNLMGVTVGAVEDYEIRDEKVLVTFSLLNPDVFIPAGSVCTIQFTGLAGSKTLEIIPPEKPPDKYIALVTKDPIRISSVVAVMAQTAESLASGSENLLKILGGQGTIANIRDNISDFAKIVHNAAEGSYEFKQDMEEARVVIKNYLKDSLDTMNNYVAITDKIVASMNARDYDAETRSILRYLRFTMIYFYRDLRESRYQRIFEDFGYAGTAINRRFNFRIFGYIDHYHPARAIAVVDAINTQIVKYGNYFDRAYCRLMKVDEEKFFRNLEETTDRIENVTESMEKAI